MAAIKPGRYDPAKPDLELFDFKSKKRYGLKLEGSGALQVGTISQDDSVHIRSAGKRIGDFDEQRSWKGGRGIEKLSSNPAGYWDSKDAWTLTEGHVHQTLLWRFARGLKAVDFDLPSKTKSLSWRAITSDQTYYSISWLASSSYNMDYARLWLKRVGNPQALRVFFHVDNGGVPGTVNQFIDITTSNITDSVSKLQLIDFSTVALTNGVRYHISVGGQSGTTHNKQNHWEIGGYSGGTVGLISTNQGSSWAAAGFDPFFYVSAPDTNRFFWSFFLDDAMYLVDKKDSGAVSQLYINGDRGKATGGTSTVLTDSGKAWVSNRWVGARVRIIRGTGAGQLSREIISNNTTQLEVAAWTTTPDTTSEYIIYATEWFSEITGIGLGRVVSEPLVCNQIVYFSHGEAALTRWMVWNGTSYSAGNETGSSSFLVKSMDATGIRIWRIRNKTAQWQNPTISFATAATGANPPAALVFGTEKNVGDANHPATGMCEKDGTIYAFKEDGVWTTNSSTFVLTNFKNGIEKMPSFMNGLSNLAHQQFVYYSWQHSLIRIYGSTHDDVGQDWSGKGLPDSREGNFSCLDAYTSLLVAAVDAGTGTSSVLGFDGLGWHEMIRAYDSNKRIRWTKVQPCQDTRNRHWTEIGGDLVYQEMPLFKGSPRLDSGVRYMHEAVIESASIDMGTASGLPKFIKELTVYCENLGNNNEVYVDFQVDDDVHTGSWTNATVLYTAPEATAFLGLNNVRAFAYRLRICSSDNTAPVDVLGVIPNGYARSPYKMVWTMRCRADNVTSRGRIVKPDVLMRWLLDNARFPGRIHMKSQYELAHDFYVIIHPPRMFPYKPAQNGQAEESILTLVLEEI